MNILAVGAHFDDVELGCGATLKKLHDDGNNIFIFVGTKSDFVSASTFEQIRSEEDALQEGKNAASMLGAKLILGDFSTFDLDYSHRLNTIITQIVEKYQIDIVFSHYSGDPHHDHWGLSMAIYHGAKHVKRILEYQSSWYSGRDDFEPNFFVDVSEYMDYKHKLLQNYSSEFSRVGEKWLQFCDDSAQLYGLRNDCSFAEGFRCVRWLL